MDGVYAIMRDKRRPFALVPGRACAAHGGDDRQHPPSIFVVGCQRSDTTLLRLILDSHPNISCGNAYASWADWRRLASTHGWSVIDAGTYSLGSDPATIRTQTCGTLRSFYDHGFTDAWGMYAYPSGRYNATAAPIINSCFAYARVYGGSLNTGPDIPAPYSIRAESLDGGNCNLAGQPCSSIFKRNYDSPAMVTGRLSPGANQWGLVQFYHLVTGSRPRNGTAPAWDCRNPDWRYHWSTLAEYYCADDFFNAVRAAKTSWGANVGAATPAQVALAWGRGNPNTP